MEVETKRKNSSSIIRHGSFGFFANATVVKLSTRWIVSTSGGGFGIDLHMRARNFKVVWLDVLTSVFDGPIWLENSQRDRSFYGVVVARGHAYTIGSSNVAIQSRQEVLLHPPSKYTYIYLSVYICLCPYRCIYTDMYIYIYI